MEYNLSAIQDTLFDITNVITSVINVDVTIADNNLNRITATGIYMSKLGKKLSSKCVFSKSLSTGESFIIENPRMNEVCTYCDRKKQCIEFAQVCCPIIVNNIPVGVIGLIAFNEKQKKSILENEINLLEFLKKISELIASKLLENKSTNKIKKLANELDTAIDLINLGVISTDKNGLIIRSNKNAQNFFGCNNVVNGKNISNILSDFNFTNKENIRNASFYYNKNKKKFNGIYNLYPITVNKEITGYVFTFNKLEEIISVFGTLVGSSRKITFDNILGESKVIKELKNEAKQFAKNNSSILIQGESGTGKELFARAIHNYSSNKNQPFIAINCSALPENLIESELFGYEEGAFTGAKKGGNPGKFEIAGNGTIFLDEVGDIPIHLQAKLLRVLQEKSFMRVGGTKSLRINARIISATNRNLEKMIKEGEFRKDLYFRLNVIPLFVPPLRERINDILLLSNYFLQNFSKQFNKPEMYFNDKLVKFFLSYSWPGNIRELENTIEYIVNVSNNNIITIDNLPNRMKEKLNNFNKNSIVVKNAFSFKNNTNIKTINELEKNEIMKCLKLFGRNNAGIEKSAKALNIGRATLYRKIKKYNL